MSFANNPTAATSRRLATALAAALTVTGLASAQVGSNYIFTQSSGTYTPITGGTVLAFATGASGAAALDDVNYPVALPFPFAFDFVPETNIYVNTNGNLTFGATAPATTNYSPLSATTAYDGAIAPFGRDLMGGWMTAGDRTLGSDLITNVANMGPMQVGDFVGGTGIPTGATIIAINGNTIQLSANATTTGTAGYMYAAGPWAEIRYETFGTSPNQVFVVQWSNFRRYTLSALTTAQHMALNFQVRLYEGTGKIECVYGNCDPGLTTFTTTNQVGLRGPTNVFPANVNNRLNTKGVNDDWMNSAAGTANSSGMLFNNVAPANVIQNGLTYTWDPPQGAYAGFTADVTSGPSPLAVQFTDASFTTEPTGITSWAWDLDGDGITDSTAQNPSWVYTSCGSYTVSLTVGDGISPPNTLTRTAYITTDSIVAGFSTQVIGPLAVQFTDTSNMPATSWAWDLDGDGITDSNLQNPAWVYPNLTPVTVSLTVTRLCSAPSTITHSVTAAQTLSQNVAANNGLSTGASVYFDLDVTNPAGLSISSLDVVASVANTAFTVEMWVRPGTSFGFEGVAADWVLAGIATGTPATSTTVPTPAVFPLPLYLPPGLSGIKLRYLGVGPRYQTLTASQVVSNGDATLTVGTSRGSTVADPWAGSNIANRGWSGTIYYATHNIAGLAGYGLFAPGCPGSMGRSSLTPNATPALGTTLNVTIDNLPVDAAIMMVGFSNTNSLLGPLPFDVSGFGAPGCSLRVSPDANQLILGASNAAVWTLNVPNNAGLSGLPMFNQALVFDPGFNGAAAVASNAAALQIGN